MTEDAKQTRTATTLVGFVSQVRYVATFSLAVVASGMALQAITIREVTDKFQGFLLSIICLLLANLIKPKRVLE